jgi:hypothetical protein
MAIGFIVLHKFNRQHATPSPPSTTLTAARHHRHLRSSSQPVPPPYSTAGFTYNFRFFTTIIAMHRSITFITAILHHDTFIITVQTRTIGRSVAN